MRGDRPYQFKVHSSYEFPGGLTLSEGFVYSAGAPLSALAARRLNQGLRAYYMTPRGSMGRLPDNWTLDLHAGWRVPGLQAFGSAVSLIADVFNVTNQHTALDVDEEYFWHGQADYKQWIAPGNLDPWGRSEDEPFSFRQPVLQHSYEVPAATVGSGWSARGFLRRARQLTITRAQSITRHFPQCCEWRAEVEAPRTPASMIGRTSAADVIRTRLAVPRITWLSLVTEGAFWGPLV